MSKQVNLKDDVHEVCCVVKFYAKIDIKTFVDELLREALTSENVLNKVLMNNLLNRKKVDVVLQKLKKETFL